MIVEVDKKTKDLFDTTDDCVIDFWSPTCPKCVLIKEKIIPQIEEFYGDTLKIILVDVSSIKKFCVQLRVRSLPAFVIFKDGQMVEKLVGYDCKQTSILEKVKEVFG